MILGFLLLMGDQQEYELHFILRVSDHPSEDIPLSDHAR